jgi:hypothetical protein
MKRRLSGRRLAGGLALLLVAAIAGVALVPNLRADPPGASPATLNRIAGKNERAAIEAAAQLRDESRTTAQAADSIRAAQERGRARADATLARFDDAEARTRPAARPTADQ